MNYSLSVAALEWSGLVVAVQAQTDALQQKYFGQITAMP